MDPREAPRATGRVGGARGRLARCALECGAEAPLWVRLGACPDRGVKVPFRQTLSGL